MTLHRQTPRLGITAAMRREEARPSGWARGGEGAEMRSVHVTPHTAHTPAARLGTGTLGSLRQRSSPGPRGARAKAAPAPLHGAGDPGRAVPAFRRRVARGRLAGTASVWSSGRCWRPRLPHSGGRRAEAASGPRELSPRLRQSGAGADGTTARRGRSASRPEEEGPEDCPRVTASQAREGKAGPQAPPPAQPECGRWGRQGTPAPAPRPLPRSRCRGGL